MSQYNNRSKTIKNYKSSTFSQPHDKITVRHIFVHVPRSHFFIKPHNFFRKIINFNYFLNNDFLLCYFFPFIYFIQSYFLCIFFYLFQGERETMNKWNNNKNVCQVTSTILWSANLQLIISIVYSKRQVHSIINFFYRTGTTHKFYFIYLFFLPFSFISLENLC